MKANKQFWIFWIFVLVLILPVIPIVQSFVQIRSSVVADQEIQWQQGQEQKMSLAPLAAGNYEVRVESLESKWTPTLKAQWKLQEVGTGQVLQQSSETVEWNMTRPLTMISLNQTAGPLEFSILFENSNPEKFPVHLRISHDREALLQKGTRDFSLYLAISLVLFAAMWVLFLRRPKAAV